MLLLPESSDLYLPCEVIAAQTKWTTPSGGWMILHLARYTLMNFHNNNDSKDTNHNFDHMVHVQHTYHVYSFFASQQWVLEFKSLYNQETLLNINENILKTHSWVYTWVILHVYRDCFSHMFISHQVCIQTQIVCKLSKMCKI